MNNDLVKNLTEQYRKIKNRGYIMIKGFDGKWHRKVTADAGKMFLNRFDESVQRRIKTMAGEVTGPVTITQSGHSISF